MKMHYWVIALGIYMVVMGFAGYVRTTSPTALYINGGIGVITLLGGIMLGAVSGVWVKIVFAWSGLITFLLIFMTVKRLAAQSDIRTGSELIFGTQAVFALIVSILLLRQLLRGTSA